MGFEARRDSLLSSTSSDTRSNYSQSTGSEKDSDDDPIIENTQHSHVTTPEKHPEASEIPLEKAQSSPRSEADTEENLSLKLAKIKTTFTDLLDEADKALSEASLSGGNLQNRLKSTEKERDHYRKRKEDYKGYKLVLERKIQELRNDLAAFQNIMTAVRNELAASQQEVTNLRKARSEMIEMGKRIFAA